jgi:hypothetical protein
MLTSNLSKGGSRWFFSSNDDTLGDTWLSSGGGILAVSGASSFTVSDVSAPGPTLHAIDSTGDHTLSTGAFAEPAVSSKNAYWFESGVLHSFAFAGAAASAPKK